MALTAVSILLLAVAGCGAEGVSQGAIASVYVTAPLCAEAQQALTRHGAGVGEVRLRVRCLPAADDLAAIGTGARRAVEDSTTIAYVGPADPTAVRFSETILEEGGIAQLPTSLGATAMEKLIHAVDEAGKSSNLRESVDSSLGNA